MTLENYFEKQILLVCTLIMFFVPLEIATYFMTSYSLMAISALSFVIVGFFIVKSLMLWSKRPELADSTAHLLIFRTPKRVWIVSLASAVALEMSVKPYWSSLSADAANIYNGLLFMAVTVILFGFRKKIAVHTARRLRTHYGAIT